MKNQKNTIAVVDLQVAVAASAQVKALKEEQVAKSEELNQWLQKAQAEVKAEEDKTKQEALLKQYNAEFAQKKAEIVQHYQAKLKVVCDNISQTITEEAEKKGYQLVLAKNLVICGGIDITEEITKIIK